MARRYLNNYTTLLSASLTNSATTMTVGTAPDALTPGDFYRLQISRVGGGGILLAQEFVDVTAISGNDLTITRAAENSTAQIWDAGARVELVETAETFNDIDLSGYMPTSGGTLTDGTITEYTETINAAAGATLDRSTGGIQHLNLAANTTLNLSDLTAGQSVMYRVTGGTTYTLSCTGLGAWSNGTTPTLSATHYLEFVHDGVEVVGFDCGGR
jgi:hypothetical protein